MQNLGVIEIFFGPAWSEKSRMQYAEFLEQNGFSFYMYGPKADGRLRKHWMEPWPAEYIDGLRRLCAQYRKHGIQFGIVLSPFGLHEKIDSQMEKCLKEKTRTLEEVGCEMLGIFFDDMPNAKGLAARQIKVLEWIQECTRIPIVFCPSFYSFDPILDRVFGQREPDYLDQIGESVPAEIEILWTGPKVISPEIPADHLKEVARILKRKPFICDNVFANDGPKNCKFIKFKDPLGRTPDSLNYSTFWAFNPMNQAEISKQVLLAALSSLKGEVSPENAIEKVWEKTCSKNFNSWLKAHRQTLVSTGLDAIAEPENKSMLKALGEFKDPAARELEAWLQGQFNVGNECLTD